MPRHPRVHAEGLLYHVMARGNDGQKIFLSQNDYQAFIEALRTVRQRYPFFLYAYVLMSNHYLCGAQHKKCYVKLRIM
jgi:putative transposase